MKPDKSDWLKHIEEDVLSDMDEGYAERVMRNAFNLDWKIQRNLRLTYDPFVLKMYKDSIGICYRQIDKFPQINDYLSPRFKDAMSEMIDIVDFGQQGWDQNVPARIEKSVAYVDSVSAIIKTSVSPYVVDYQQAKN